MALQIVRNDLAQVVADAIVIPANSSAKIGGGTETSIYTAAGKEKLLTARKKSATFNRAKLRRRRLLTCKQRF